MVIRLVVTVALITELLHLAMAGDGFAPIITSVPVITFCVMWGGVKAGLFTPYHYPNLFTELIGFQPAEAGGKKIAW